MSPGQDPTISEAAAAAIPLSASFCADDADIVIRAEGTLDFRVHKCILSLVSLFFKDMFTIPQPLSITSSVLPHVSVQETAKTWENILWTIYPTLPNPNIDTFDDLESLLFAAKKYEIRCIFNSHEKCFERRTFIEQDPLRLYAIACWCGLDDRAKYVARNADLQTVLGRDQSDDLNGLTLAAYRRLITFLFKRDKEFRPIQERYWASFTSTCDCTRVQTDLYARTRRELEKPYVQMEETYLVALGGASGYRKKACGRILCALDDRRIREFLEQLFKTKEEVYSSLMWE